MYVILDGCHCYCKLTRNRFITQSLRYQVQYLFFPFGQFVVCHIFSSIVLQSAQRDCRKTDRGESHPRVPGTQYGQSSFSVALSGSGRRPEDVELADIIIPERTAARPLYIHFQFRAEHESALVFMHADIRKDRVSAGSTASSTIPSRRA